MKSMTLNISDELYDSFRQLASKQGKLLEDVVTEWLSRHPARRQPAQAPDQAEAARQRFRRHFGAAHSGNPRSGDNDGIDADLVREYGRASGGAA